MARSDTPPVSRHGHPSHTPTILFPIGSVMSPYLVSADLAATELGRRARTNTTVAEATVLSISDLFAEYATASRTRRAELRLAADPQLLAELDGFNYPATA